MLADGSAAPEHIKPGMIPPAWTDVQVSLDPAADLLVTARDAAGRKKSVYADSFHSRNAAAKFARVSELLAKERDVYAQNQANRGNQEYREAADCLWLIQVQATRPGSDGDTKAKVKAYGATTLLAEHVVEDDGVVALDFIGKEGVHHHHLISDPELAKMLLERKRSADHRGGKLFDVSDQQLRDYSRLLDGGRFTPKDFRTALATRLAADEIKKHPPCCRSKKEYQAAVKAVATVVSGILGNRPSQAVQSYIAPEVWSIWRVA